MRIQVILCLTLGGRNYRALVTREVLAQHVSVGAIAVKDLWHPIRGFAICADLVHAMLGGAFSGSTEDLYAIIADENQFPAVFQAVQ